MGLGAGYRDQEEMLRTGRVVVRAGMDTRTGRGHWDQEGILDWRETLGQVGAQRPRGGFWDSGRGLEEKHWDQEGDRDQEGMLGLGRDTGTPGDRQPRLNSSQAPSSSPTLGAEGGCGRVWGGPEGVVGLGRRSHSWGVPPRMSPFSCRLWSGGRLTMKRLSLLFTRFFSEASGVWGAPGGTVGPECGHGHSHTSPEACSPPRPPSPTWSPGPLSDPRCLVLVPAELPPSVPTVQPTHRHVHRVLQVLWEDGRVVRDS